MKKFRLMIIHDVHVEHPKGRIMWAYARRSAALAKYAPPDFEVETFQYSEVPWKRCGEFDAVFNLEYAAPSRREIKRHGPNTVLFCSFNSDSRRRQHLWPLVKSEADWVIFNNLDAFNHYGRPKNSCCISNGIDSDIWRPIVPNVERRPRVLWCGSSGPTKGKGYAEVFRPLEKILPALGFETDFIPINDIKPGIVKNTEDTLAWYQSGFAICCASLSEGTPGTSLEGLACGCVLVTVKVGNSLEFGRDKENVVFVERTPESFAAGLQYALEHRERLSAAGAKLMRDEWSYGEPGHRAKYYFNVIRRVLTGGMKSVRSFAYNEVAWQDI